MFSSGLGVHGQRVAAGIDVRDSRTARAAPASRSRGRRGAPPASSGRGCCLARQRQRHFGRQLVERRLRAGLRYAEPADHDGDARAARARPGPGIDVERPPAVGGADRQRAVSDCSISALSGRCATRRFWPTAEGSRMTTTLLPDRRLVGGIDPDDRRAGRPTGRLGIAPSAPARLRAAQRSSTARPLRPPAWSRRLRPACGTAVRARRSSRRRRSGRSRRAPCRRERGSKPRPPRASRPDAGSGRAAARSLSVAVSWFTSAAADPVQGPDSKLPEPVGSGSDARNAEGGPCLIARPPNAYWLSTALSGLGGKAGSVFCAAQQVERIGKLHVVLRIRRDIGDRARALVRSRRRP